MLNVESLEVREVPAAVLVGDTLQITPNNPVVTNWIQIKEINDTIQVRVNRAISYFDADDVDKLVINGGRLADVISNETDIDCLINGRGGNDRISGGMGDNIIVGGAGNDTVYSLRGTNNIDVRGQGKDVVVTTNSAQVGYGIADIVVRFADQKAYEDWCHKHPEYDHYCYVDVDHNHPKKKHEWNGKGWGHYKHDHNGHH